MSSSTKSFLQKYGFLAYPSIWKPAYRGKRSIKSDPLFKDIVALVEDEGTDHSRRSQMVRARVSPPARQNSLFSDASGSTAATSRHPSAMSVAIQAPLRELNLEASGANGISQLVIAESFINRLNANGFTNSRRPCEVFDVITGSSFAGITAIMLVHMRMTIDDAIVEYKELLKKAFAANPVQRKINYGKDKYLFTSPKFSQKPLIKAVKKLFKKYNVDTSRRFCETNGECMLMVVVSSATHYNMPSRRKVLRSYAVGSKEASKVTIFQACMATTADPAYFEPQELDGALYVDGRMGNANPAFLLVDDCLELFPGRPHYLLSLGAGAFKPVSFKPWGLFHFLRCIIPLGPNFANKHCKCTI